MPSMGINPKALFDIFSGFQLLHSSVRTLILYNAAELSHAHGEGQRNPMSQLQAFYSPDFLYLSPLPNGSTRSPYPPPRLGANYGTAALQGISQPGDHHGCSASCGSLGSCPGPERRYPRKDTFPKAVWGVLGERHHYNLTPAPPSKK